MTTALDDLLDMSPRQLKGALEAGYAIDPAALDDTQYRGISLGVPDWFAKVAWKKFMKTFRRDPETGELRGWNVRITDDGLDRPWTPIPGEGGAPKTFGHYRVEPLDGHRMPVACDEGLMINYGAGLNARHDPMNNTRDPIVAVNAGDHDLLLGWSYVELGPLRLPTPFFFSLEREGPLRHLVDPPGWR